MKNLLYTFNQNKYNKMLLNHNIIKVNKILKIKMLKDNGHQLINNIMNQKRIILKIYQKY